MLCHFGSLLPQRSEDADELVELGGGRGGLQAQVMAAGHQPVVGAAARMSSAINRVRAEVKGPDDITADVKHSAQVTLDNHRIDGRARASGERLDFMSTQGRIKGVELEFGPDRADGLFLCGGKRVELAPELRSGAEIKRRVEFHGVLFPCQRLVPHGIPSSPARRRREYRRPWTENTVRQEL